MLPMTNLFASETFAFVSVTGESDDPMAVLSKIQSYISALAKQGVSNEALERSRRVLYSEFVKDFDSTEEIANNMIDFILDGAGTRPAWFCLTKGGISFACNFILAIIITNILAPDDRK